MMALRGGETIAPSHLIARDASSAYSSAKKEYVTSLSGECARTAIACCFLLRREK